jgi:death-on-curing protein
MLTCSVASPGEAVQGDIDHLGLDDLASAAARPRMTANGEDAYPVRNHALVDGNKRLAWAATRVFCLLNGRDLVLGVDAAETLVVAVAAGEVDVPELTTVIGRHLVEGSASQA